MNLTQGDIFKDQRGTLRFFNELDMTEIVRFYEISPGDIQFKRGWQGHQNEKKWFYCLSGELIINVIKIDDFENPSADYISELFVLGANNPQVLCVPGGHATAIKAIMKNSRLQVFSNFSLEDSKKDDFRYPIDFWKVNWTA